MFTNQRSSSICATAWARFCFGQWFSNSSGVLYRLFPKFTSFSSSIRWCFSRLAYCQGPNYFPTISFPPLYLRLWTLSDILHRFVDDRFGVCFWSSVQWFPPRRDSSQRGLLQFGLFAHLLDCKILHFQEYCQAGYSFQFHFCASTSYFLDRK